MKRTILIGAASALALMAGACGTSEEAAQNEVAVANDMNTMMADPSNPFAQAEAQMHERMMAASGADPSETWVRKMIEHHRGAIAMSDIVLAQNPTPQVRAEAERMRSEQMAEISKLEAMLADGEATSAAPATAGPPAQAAPAAKSQSQPGAPASTAGKPAAKPATEPPPQPAPDPHAGHDMNNMQ